MRYNVEPLNLPQGYASEWRHSLPRIEGEPDGKAKPFRTMRRQSSVRAGGVFSVALSGRGSLWVIEPRGGALQRFLGLLSVTPSA